MGNTCCCHGPVDQDSAEYKDGYQQMPEEPTHTSRPVGGISSDSKPVKDKNNSNIQQKEDGSELNHENNEVEQSAKQHQLDTVEGDTSNSIDPRSCDKWSIFKEFGNVGDAQGEFKIAKGIAVSQDGEIAVTEHGHDRVYLFSEDGTYTLSLASSGDIHSQAKLLYPTDVAFTSHGHIAVADQSKNIKMFGKDGAFLSSFNLKGVDESRDTRPKAYSIEVISDDLVLVGDIRRKVITLHKEEDGTSERISKINLNIEPHFLAADMNNGRHQIVACDWHGGVVVAVDPEVEDKAENVIFSLDAFTVDGEPGLPKGLACDNESHMYIAVSKLDDSADKKNVFINTGHIHQYSCRGEFQRCLIKGLYHPRGITWQNGSLYVANTHSVIILSVG